MANDDLVSLSIELEELIRAQYAPEVQSVVQAILLSYGTDRSQQAVDRVRFDLLYLGNGDVSRLQQLAILAKQDARDVMSQEYFRIDGQTYPHPWARRHLVNRDKAYPPKQGAAILTTAKLIVRRQSSGSNKMLDRLSTSSKPHLLPSLFLTFSNANQLLELADQMQALAEAVMCLICRLPYSIEAACIRPRVQSCIERTGRKRRHWSLKTTSCLGTAMQSTGPNVLAGV
jgi:hypothetical protein